VKPGWFNLAESSMEVYASKGALLLLLLLLMMMMMVMKMMMMMPMIMK
jgi:hypothetical protein